MNALERLEAWLDVKTGHWCWIDTYYALFVGACLALLMIFVLVPWLF